MSHFVGRAVTSGVIGLFVMAYGDYPLTGFRDLRAFRTRHPARSYIYSSSFVRIAFAAASPVNNAPSKNPPQRSAASEPAQ